MLLTTCNCRDHAPRRVHTFDISRAQREQRRQWQRSKRAEDDYGRQLRGVADQIDRLVRGLFDTDEQRVTAIEAALAEYSRLLKPWAESVSARMLADVNRRDEAMWDTFTRDMGKAMKFELARAPTGQLLKDMLAENVDLITSLPREAAQRVHELALKRLETSGRAAEIAAEILKTGEVTKSRATLIARTEVARAASGLIEARATYLGSEGYIWRTSRDADVRNTDGNPRGSHRLLEGKFIRWDKPPVAAKNGTRAHAGQIYNCRCWPEPVLPKVF